jgi:hypothetical protein
MRLAAGDDRFRAAFPGRIFALMTCLRFWLGCLLVLALLAAPASWVLNASVADSAGCCCGSAAKCPASCCLQPTPIDLPAESSPAAPAPSSTVSHDWLALSADSCLQGVIVERDHPGFVDPPAAPVPDRSDLHKRNCVLIL